MYTVYGSNHLKDCCLRIHRLHADRLHMTYEVLLVTVMGSSLKSRLALYPIIPFSLHYTATRLSVLQLHFCENPTFCQWEGLLWPKTLEDRLWPCWVTSQQGRTSQPCLGLGSCQSHYGERVVFQFVFGGKASRVTVSNRSVCESDHVVVQHGRNHSLRTEAGHPFSPPLYPVMKNMLTK